MNQDHRLGCGTDIDEVWDTMGQTPNAHQRSCPHCTAARRDLQPLARQTQQYRTHQDEDLEMIPEPDLIGRILTMARAEVRRGQRLPLSQRTDGSPANDGLRISEQALAMVARRAADTFPEVQVRRCGVSIRHTIDHRPDHLADPDLREPTRVNVAVRLSIASTASVPNLSGPLRTAITKAVQTQVGMVVDRIDLTVEDLHDA